MKKISGIKNAERISNSMQKEIIIEEYNKEWTNWFKEIRNIIKSGLGALTISIEHVGSTSIEGLAAKPIIDIDVVVHQKDFSKVKSKFSGLGYIHQGDLGIPGREAFDLIDAKKKDLLPDHHLYVCDKDNPELKRHIWFRDYLRNSPLYIKKYEKIKKDAAKRHPFDIDSYIKCKNAFIEKILNIVEKNKKEI